MTLDDFSRSELAHFFYEESDENLVIGQRVTAYGVRASRRPL